MFRQIALAGCTFLVATQVASAQSGDLFSAFDGDADGRVTKEELFGAVGDVNLVVGAKGDPLQLILNTCFHLSQPIDNVPHSLYRELKVGKYAKMVKTAIPLCLGDNYKGARVVGTIPDLFTQIHLNGAEGDRKAFTFQKGGRNFKQEGFHECVVGAKAAKKLKIRLGDKLVLTHGLGLGDFDAKHDKHAFTVVGILEPTQRPYDSAIYVNMEGFLLIPEHLSEEAQQSRRDAKDGEKPKPLADKFREITAILVVAKAPNGIEAFADYNAMELARKINDGNEAQAVYPIRVLDKWIRGAGLHLLPLMMAREGGTVLRKDFTDEVERWRPRGQK